MAKQQSAEEKAVALLTRMGYDVRKPQPIVMFGDVYEIDGKKVLIMLHDPSLKTSDGYGPWNYGGYVIDGFGKNELDDYYREEVWMCEYQRSLGKYKWLGHVDLSKFIK